MEVNSSRQKDFFCIFGKKQGNYLDCKDTNNNS